MASLSCSWWLAACDEDRRSSLCHLSCSALLSCSVAVGGVQWTIAIVVCINCCDWLFLRPISRFSRVGCKMNNWCKYLCWLIYDQLAHIICGLVLYVCTYNCFAYFGGYNTFTYFRGYLIVYQLMLHWWGYLCYDSCNGSHGSYVYGEREATYVSSWYSPNTPYQNTGLCSPW